jgi:hypothetical protein
MAKGIKSIRAREIIGVHEMLVGFPYQTVRLKHESISREAFGNGALLALSKNNGLYLLLLLPPVSAKLTYPLATMSRRALHCRQADNARFDKVFITSKFCMGYFAIYHAVGQYQKGGDPNIL